MSGARETTTRLINAIDEGMVDKDYVLNACLGALSEAEVHQMCLANDILFLEDDDDDE